MLQISKEEGERLKPIFRQRSFACATCPTPCNPLPRVLDLKLECPLPVSRWTKIEPKKMGLGDVVEILAKPIAQILKMDCLDKEGELKPESGCAKRRDAFNRLTK